MANTVDILGEQETLDKLVAHTLEDFEDDRITEIRRNAFYNNDSLKTINLPNLVKSGYNAFYNCYNLESIEIPKISQIGTYMFSNCFKLQDINISNSSVKTLSGYDFSNCFSLNSVDLSNIEILDTYSLQNTGIGSIILPLCIRLPYNIGGGVRTSTIDMSRQVTISSYSFRDAYSLVHLILRRELVCPLSDTSAFNNTPIANGLGWIYVPADLVNAYKAETNWSTYADQIVSIDEYPKALDGETITDTWDEIFQAENNSTYKTKYSVGDTKYLIIGGTYVLMQIIAFDRDILSSDGTSTAKITWLAKSVSFQFPMNFTNSTIGGWKDCECRKFLNDIIYEQIPENVRNKILAVNKTYNANGGTTVDKLWIPSAREIFGSSNYENEGIDYTDFFGNISLVKHTGLLTNNTSQWGLRTTIGAGYFGNISPSGNFFNSFAFNSQMKYCIGFCT